MQEKTKGLPKHKKFSESMFMHLDRLLRENPSITTISSETYIMFAHNKTSEWLEAKSSTEKANIFASARKSMRKIRTAFKVCQVGCKESCHCQQNAKSRSQSQRTQEEGAANK